MFLVEEQENNSMISKLDNSNIDLIKIGSCIEFDMHFDICLDNLNNIEKLISNYKNISEDFPKTIFEKKIDAIRSDINFLEGLLFTFIDSKENYCKYLYKYND